MKKILKLIGKLFAFIGVTLGMLVITLYATLLLMCYGPSEKARNVLIPTFLETGALKWIPGLLMSETKIQIVVNSNKLTDMEAEINTDLIDLENVTDEIEIVNIKGSNYKGTMMIIHNPSRVEVATTYPFGEYGKTLDVIAKENNAIGAVNGGLYVSSGNKGGLPMGTVVSKGKVVFNEPHGSGYFLIGFDESNVLRIIDMKGKNKADMEKLVADEHIRDAVTFQEEATGDNNHFVKLIINGENREVKGAGSGYNPRTAIGQREDGTVLILVTDGRGSSGHLGASAQDLIDIMEEYGAVNAANIDGGSSSCMYYQDEYLMTSVTFYYANSSWNLPEAFIIK